MSSSLVQWRHKAFLSIGVSLRELPHWSHHVPSLNGWGQCGVRETEVNYTVRLEQQVFLLVLRHCHMLVHFNIDVLYHYDNNQESMLNGAVYLAWKLIRWVHPWLASLRGKNSLSGMTQWCDRCAVKALHMPGLCTQEWFTRSGRSLAGHRWTSSPMANRVTVGSIWLWLHMLHRIQQLGQKVLLMDTKWSLRHCFPLVRTPWQLLHCANGFAPSD